MDPFRCCAGLVARRQRFNKKRVIVFLGYRRAIFQGPRTGGLLSVLLRWPFRAGPHLLLALLLVVAAPLRSRCCGRSLPGLLSLAEEVGQAFLCVGLFCGAHSLAAPPHTRLVKDDQASAPVASSGGLSLFPPHRLRRGDSLPGCAAGPFGQRLVLALWRLFCCFYPPTRIQEVSRHLWSGSGLFHRLWKRPWTTHSLFVIWAWPLR